MEWFMPAAYDWIWTAVVLAVVAAAITAIVQINRSPALTALAQVGWTLAVLALPVVGALAWFVLRPRQGSTALRD